MLANCQETTTRPFVFNRDTFAFDNETYWEYHFGSDGKTTFRPRPQKPSYAHRCFVLTRAARQFFFHATFAEDLAPVPESQYRRLLRQVLARSPRRSCPRGERVVIPGYAGLRSFTAAHEAMVKAAAGGAWQSYVLRSHWRMVFPISRQHQARTAEALQAALKSNDPSVVHLVNFPTLTINHSLLVFAVRETAEGLEFQAYDPNNVSAPVSLQFDRQTSTFIFPANRYWAGGPLNVIEIFRSWWM
jgi:hypothetical protein